jgi:SAM-dependent methyltransferase
VATSNDKRAKSDRSSKKPKAAKRGAKRSSASKKPKYTAKTADRHELYQLSVQAPETEVDFMTRSFRNLFGRKPTTMREDFCGTALLCSAWVKSNRERTATGVDICGDTLAWGKEHNIAPLGSAAERIELLQQDVRAATRAQFDVVNALNFSYWIFRTRDELRHYFSCVHKALKKEGLFFLDAYGGWESQEPMLESRAISAGFTYVWDQDSFDPIGHSIVNHIHFEFKDGTKLERAFTYEWRYWTLPEIQELLREAGFSDVRVYWDTSDDNDVENYRVRTRADNQPGWLAYLVAVR